MSDGSGQTAWCYDVDGNVTNMQRTTAGITKNVTYTYNLNDSLASVTYPSGLAASLGYDAVGRATSVSCASGTPCNGTSFASSSTYAPQGSLASIVLGNVSGGFTGINGTYSYNSRLQPYEIKAVNSSTSTALLDLTYSFVNSSVNNGTVISVTNDLFTGRSQSYTYDQLNRLATAQSTATSGTDCWGQSFAYDRYANLTGISVTQCTAPALSLTVSSSTNRVGNTGYSYDSAGNVTADGSLTYAWSAEGRMVSTAGYTYTYDGDGRRVKKSDGRNEIDAGRATQGSNRKLYWYGLGGEVLAESDLGGNISAEYIYFNGQRIARRAPVSGNVSYFLADRLGSARIITNATGTVTEESDYLPYGTERPLTDPHTADNDYKFTGHERDSESGLDHTLNRQYSSNTGRWLSADVGKARGGNPQSWNRYSYTGGNPMNRVDLDGKDWCDDPDVYGFFAACTGGGDNGLDPGPGGCVLGATMFMPINGMNCVDSWAVISSMNTKPAPPPPCWEDGGRIVQTFLDLTANIVAIAGNSIHNNGEINALSGVLRTDIDTEYLNYILPAIANGSPPPGIFVGGHFNLLIPIDDALQTALGDAFITFLGLFGGTTSDGVRRDAVYGQPRRGNYTLHSGVDDLNNPTQFNAHFDLHGLQDVISAVGHLIGDVIGGHMNNSCKDPAWVTK